ncbi:hypothetical protein [Opitutus sp. GAS368]|jgi:hypothetical protein|uniref:hypothetical protein n=1 Tax=Opitutus sp. GAS368 TaxID=1882749 RepID=UPI00087A66FF|nr:hypothetical protein [Opitutus sp. GAS368]SDR65341.1 hypothetical protein SAMN05444173_0035 [Opitutus sp. GAS368]
MLLAAIVILFSALALGMLALLDRYQSAADKAHVERRTSRPNQPSYYDAFTDRRQASGRRKPDDPQLAA